MSQLDKEELEELENLGKSPMEYSPSDVQLIEWWIICEMFIGNNDMTVSAAMQRFIKDRKIEKGGLGRSV